MPHKIQNEATQHDIDRGYKVCDTCRTKAHVFEAGYDCTTWQQCNQCESWVVDKSEFDND